MSPLTIFTRKISIIKIACLFVCLMVNRHYGDVLLPLPLHGVGA